jgi:aromatic amino acid aminotransferase I
MVHSPPYEDWDLTLSVGNTFAFEACVRNLLVRGDTIILEEYAYTGAIYTCRCVAHVNANPRPQGITLIGIGMDEEGMRADLLDTRLSSWKTIDGRKPRVACIVPYLLSVCLTF